MCIWRNQCIQYHSPQFRVAFYMIEQFFIGIDFICFSVEIIFKCFNKLFTMFVLLLCIYS